MTGRLQGKVAVVTGAGLGLGQAAARRLASEGARVVVADIDAAAGEAVVAGITAQGGQTLFVRTDVAQSAQVEALMQTAVAHFGGLDVLYSNAAIQPHDQDTIAHV